MSPRTAGLAHSKYMVSILLDEDVDIHVKYYTLGALVDNEDLEIHQKFQNILKQIWI